MKKNLLIIHMVILLSLFLIAENFSQEKSHAEKVNWLKNHTVPIRTIDPSDNDFSDLMPLVQILGDVEIVQLGENTHGDGAAFTAKNRLIRFLHQVMGFDVLAWEAGFFDCRLLEAALKSDMPVQEASCRALYKLWCNCAEVIPLLEYARKTQSTTHPLTIAGFDCRVSTEIAREKLFPEFIFSFFDRLDPKILSPKDRQDFRTMSIRLLPADYYKYPEKRQFNDKVAKHMIDILDQDKERFLCFVGEREFQYVRQTLVSFLNMARSLREMVKIIDQKEFKDIYTRDTAMAENILWLSKEYFPGRKIIVWAHNYHIMRDFPMTGLNPAQDEKLETMKLRGPHGRLLSRERGNKIYTIGITGYRGAWGYAGEKPESISPSEPGSLDNFLHQTGFSFSFLDFRHLSPTHWLRAPLPGRFSFWESQTAYWTRLYDGVLFIDTMTPATKLQ